MASSSSSSSSTSPTSPTTVVLVLLLAATLLAALAPVQARVSTSRRLRAARSLLTESGSGCGGLDVFTTDAATVVAYTYSDLHNGDTGKAWTDTFGNCYIIIAPDQSVAGTGFNYQTIEEVGTACQELDANAVPAAPYTDEEALFLRDFVIGSVGVNGGGSARAFTGVRTDSTSGSMVIDDTSGNIIDGTVFDVDRYNPANIHGLWFPQLWNGVWCTYLQLHEPTHSFVQYECHGSSDLAVCMVPGAGSSVNTVYTRPAAV